jgi:hypothetical protein
MFQPVLEIMGEFTTKKIDKYKRKYLQKYSIGKLQ